MNKDENAYKELLKGIQFYIKECIDNCGYDRTYTAIITNEHNDNTYDIVLNKVKYNNIRTIGGTCKLNETVRVLIPQNNFNNMFILKG